MRWAYRVYHPFMYRYPALLGWEGLAEGGVDLHKMPVYPAGMLVEPFVEKTAAVLTACIDEALAGQRISVS